MSENENEVNEITISEFRPYLNRFKVTFKVISKEETQEVTNRNSDETHLMSNVTIADPTASVILTAWDDDIEYLEIDKYYSLTNGYVNLYRDSMRLARGKYGEFSEEEDADFEPTLEPNRSDEQHERRQRRPRYQNRPSGYTY